MWSHTEYLYIRELFEKFVDLPYYSKLELCGGAVMVSFSKYLPWQMMHFLWYSTQFSIMCCIPLITLKFCAPELPFHGWKSPEITWGGCSNGVPPIHFLWAKHNSIQISPYVISGPFQPWKGSSKVRNFEVINGLQHVFEKWAECCKKCIACKEKKRPSPHLHKVVTRSNKVSPWT
jgi:hypothetical protein